MDELEQEANQIDLEMTIFEYLGLEKCKELDAELDVVFNNTIGEQHETIT
jgi:hypothetical protein